MKYKIEISKYHRIVETYENNDIKKILKWYIKNWQQLHNYGGCSFSIYEENRKLSIDEENDLGFI